MPEPLRYRFRVNCPPGRAFQLWTASAGVWWPIATHSVSGRRDSVLVIEPGAGGRIYEQVADGRQFSWGTVVAWQPAVRLVCEWLVGDTPTELEVRFAADAGGAAGLACRAPDAQVRADLGGRRWVRGAAEGRDLTQLRMPGYPAGRAAGRGTA